MISLQSSLVSPALLEELIDEISTLASVFHKPAETFIGKGRLGADEVQRKANELSTIPVFLFFKTTVYDATRPRQLIYICIVGSLMRHGLE